MKELMGILNLTAQSIDQGHPELANALAHTQQMLDEGATIIDVGAQATNPWAEDLGPDEELAIMRAALPALLERFPGQRFSIDTFRAPVAAYALELGAWAINDVMTFRDPSLREVVGRYRPVCIVSHAPLSAGSIAEVHKEKMDDASQVVREINEQINLLVEEGVPFEHIHPDPGIGFGKSMRLNHRLVEYGKIVPDSEPLIGHSQKRFLITDPLSGEVIEGAEKTDPEHNVEIGQRADRAGAWALRVHAPRLYKHLLQT